MLRRRRCEPCRSPFPRMLDIYTAVQIRGQSAAALTPGALVNDGRTATVGCALRLAWAVGRALGNFAVNEAIAWTGAPLRRLAAPFPPPSDRGCRLCRFSISTVLWRCRRPPRWRLPAQQNGSEVNDLRLRERERNGSVATALLPDRSGKRGVDGRGRLTVVVSK